MRIIDVENIKDASIFRKTHTVNGVIFLKFGGKGYVNSLFGIVYPMKMKQ